MMKCDWCDKDATVRTEIKPARKLSDGAYAAPVYGYACPPCARRLRERYGTEFERAPHENSPPENV